MSFIESFFNKRSEELKVEDIQHFIEKKIEENVNLDYKTISLVGNIEKLARHVCAFANAEGGLLILGVSEEKLQIGKRKERIYPGDITWADHLYTKERLEKAINAQNDPKVPLKIIPLRKSKDDPKVIFLLDIPKSNKLHMHKNTYRFYKRLNFESVPMEREEVMNFIKVRLSYERCAWFRFHLDAILVDHMDGVLVRLNPEYAPRKFDPKKIKEEFKDFIMLSVEKVIDVIKQVNIRKLIKFDEEILDLVTDLEKIDSYSHEDITPEENVLFDGIRQEATQLSRNWREFCSNEAEFHKININWWSLPCIEFAKATKDEDHFLKNFSNYVKFLLPFLQDILKLKVILDELQRKYGKFESCKVVQLSR